MCACVRALMRLCLGTRARGAYVQVVFVYVCVYHTSLYLCVSVHLTVCLFVFRPGHPQARRARLPPGGVRSRPRGEDPQDPGVRPGSDDGTRSGARTVLVLYGKPFGSTVFVYTNSTLCMQGALLFYVITNYVVCCLML